MKSLMLCLDLLGASFFNPDMTMYFLDGYLAYNFNDKEALEEIMSTGETTTILLDRFNIKTMYNENKTLNRCCFTLGLY